MTTRSIVAFPDPRLRVPAHAVTVFDAALAALAADLLDTLHAADGIGITGPHIGVPQRLVVLELPEAPASQVYVNPCIVWSSSETVQHDEGSVSMPGVIERITRAAAVRVRYDDLDGREQVEEAEGLRAVCHQHEIDQLDGIFWIDRLSRLKRERVLARFAKLRRG
ncbi:peptide deformylase [Robbsia sp. Bb-Pol-6]|uniref:Peptide deformylase-like n=1 Tax=Robbsia betulipollinis TaxID=2981849 RepID=A0ABT3ZJ35_9BURK|nr:peptide deformylase [Robbsia betulipollinis]MCY0386546.1 peptide deformylase [Robbsia betulipollinis]